MDIPKNIQLTKEILPKIYGYIIPDYANFDTKKIIEGR